MARSPLLRSPPFPRPRRWLRPQAVPSTVPLRPWRQRLEAGDAGGPIGTAVAGGSEAGAFGVAGEQGPGGAADAAGAEEALWGLHCCPSGSWARSSITPVAVKGGGDERSLFPSP